ncbi:serine hydrolase [Pelagicoccus mobilis]|uniref:Serine hydrolase n=1 Tax=Pelagicoccus mobilis TaxID=415221 RepID=A0A934VRI9_9BACT|nr:serine hydrolase [Pelagicoccus mobilis]MBK1877658.1 serine hydrolase [Pelagicoccus mobilis]
MAESHLVERGESDVPFDSLVYLPEGYSESDQSWPVLLFLHGGGESGRNLESVKRHGPPALREAGEDLPFLLVAPQNPDSRGFWKEDDLVQLLDFVEDRYRVDTDKVYLTGMSRGAYGAWRLAAENSERFAAMAVVCGAAPAPYAGWLGDLPIWVFHGEADPVIPVDESLRMVKAIEAEGGNVRLTTYPGVDHDAWTQTYLNKELYAWLLEHDLSQRSMVFPDETWKKVSPREQGVDNAALASALAVLESYCGKDGLSQTMVIRNGRVLFEGDSITKAHNIYSSTKSFTSTILGLLIEDGKCRLDTLAAEFEPLLGAAYGEIELKHFASMTSGYSARGKSRWGDASEDWSHTPYKPAEPLFSPGEAYAYWDEAMMMFGRVLTRIADEDLASYFNRKVGEEIGFGDWDWWSDTRLKDGPIIRNGCTGISMNAQQLARMGHLFLNEGRWKGKQLVPTWWVREASRSQVASEIPTADTDRSNVVGAGRYGYNWWVRGEGDDMPDTPEGTYYMSGLHNNMCFVVPEWDMVVVRMGEDGNPEEGKRFVYNAFFRELSKAIID